MRTIHPNAFEAVHKRVSGSAACRSRKQTRGCWVDFTAVERKGLLVAERTGSRGPYNAASATDWLGNNPAYFVIRTIVKTLLKRGDKPNA